MLKVGFTSDIDGMIDVDMIELVNYRDHTLKLIDIQTFEIVATLHAPTFKVTDSLRSLLTYPM